MTRTIVKTNDIVDEFALASKAKNVDHLQSLLSDSGTFDIQNEELITKEVSKQEFIQWYGQMLEETQITSIEYDQCLHCFIGNAVVLFNAGMFPRKIKDSSERSKTGIMLDIKDGLISTLKFCYLFVVAENKHVFECRMEKIKEYQSQGMSWSQAYDKATGEDKN